MKEVKFSDVWDKTIIEGLQYPQCNSGDSNESYIIQTIKGLCYDQKRNKLSALALANTFFMIEKYTDSIYKANKK
jgi:hypothetical protein